MTTIRSSHVRIFALAAGMAVVCLGSGSLLSSRHAAATAPSAVIAQLMPAAEAAPSGGAALYNQDCAACHQMAGTGVPGAFPPLASNKIVQGDPNFLSRVALYGLQGQVTVNGQSYNGAMPAFASSLTDDEISQILTYIRSSWGNSASAVASSVVSTERAKPGSADDNYKNYPK